MEEKLKLANMKTGESSDHKKYQELMNRVQEKDEQINQLETQLEEQVKWTICLTTTNGRLINRQM